MYLDLRFPIAVKSNWTKTQIFLSSIVIGTYLTCAQPKKVTMHLLSNHQSQNTLKKSIWKSSRGVNTVLTTQCCPLWLLLKRLGCFLNNIALWKVSQNAVQMCLAFHLKSIPWILLDLGSIKELCIHKGNKFHSIHLIVTYWM